MTVITLLIACLLILLNGFFVAAEFAMVKLRNTRVQILKTQHGLRGGVLATIHRHLDTYLSACQLGITLSSIGLGWIGEPAIAHLIEPLLVYLGIVSTTSIKIVSFIIAFIIISFLHIVIGELMPKSLAIRQAEVVSLWTAIPLSFFYWFMFPIIWMLNMSSNILLRKIGAAEVHEGEHHYTADELKLIFHTSHSVGGLSKDEAAILEHALEFRDLKVTDIMRPADELISLNLNKPLTENLQLISKFRYSRYPIYEDAVENITGIIHVKDLFALLEKHQTLADLNSVKRKVTKVDHELPAINLLRTLRETGSHFALVYHNHHLVGFITMDTILSVLIGRINDEFHKTEEDWVKEADGCYTLKGYISLYTIEKLLRIDIKEKDKIHTLSGLLMAYLERLPAVDELITLPQFKVLVEKMEGPRISQVKIYRN